MLNQRLPRPPNRLCITEWKNPTAEAKPKREKKKGDAFLSVIQKAQTTAQIASHKKKPKGFRLFGFSVGLPPWVGAKDKLEKRQKPPSSASVIPAYKSASSAGGAAGGGPEEMDSDLIQALTSVKIGGQDGNLSGPPSPSHSKGSVQSPRSPSTPAGLDGGRGFPVGRDGRPMVPPRVPAAAHVGAKRAGGSGLKLPTFRECCRKIDPLREQKLARPAAPTTGGTIMALRPAGRWR